MNDDECKTIKITTRMYSFLEDQKKVRKLNSMNDVISRIISEKRHIETKFTLLEDEITELKNEIAECTILEGAQE